MLAGRRLAGRRGLLVEADWSFAGLSVSGLVSGVSQAIFKS